MHSKMIFVRPHKTTKSGVKAWAYVGSANLSESAWYVPPALSIISAYLRQIAYKVLIIISRIGAISPRTR
jgi:hypothetical protein